MASELLAKSCSKQALSRSGLAPGACAVVISGWSRSWRFFFRQSKDQARMTKVGIGALLATGLARRNAEIVNFF